MSVIEDLDSFEKQFQELKEILKPFDRVSGELFSRNYENKDKVIELESFIVGTEGVKLTAKDFFEIRRILSKMPTGVVENKKQLYTILEENFRLKRACSEALERLNRVRIPNETSDMNSALSISAAKEVLRSILTQVKGDSEHD